jgi:hypothetical protein
MSAKGGKIVFGVRTTNEIAAWLRKQADKTGSTISAVIGGVCWKEIEREREAQEARADRAAGE